MERIATTVTTSITPTSANAAILIRHIEGPVPCFECASRTVDARSRSLKLPTRSYSDFDDTADGPSWTLESRPGGVPLRRSCHRLWSIARPCPAAVAVRGESRVCEASPGCPRVQRRSGVAVLASSQRFSRGGCMKSR